MVDRKAPGRAPHLNDEHRKALAATSEADPGNPWRGTLAHCRNWVFEEFRVSVSEQPLSRQLRAMGYRKLSSRPRHHAQAEGVIEAFKKVSPRAFARSR